MKLSIRCAQCGEGLTAKIDTDEDGDDSNPTLLVDRCQSCLSEAARDERSESYREGHDAGYESGYHNGCKDGRDGNA